MYIISLSLRCFKSILTMIINFIVSGLKKFPTTGFGIAGLYLLQTIQFFEYFPRISKNSVFFITNNQNFLKETKCLVRIIVM